MLRDARMSATKTEPKNLPRSTARRLIVPFCTKSDAQIDKTSIQDQLGVKASSDGFAIADICFLVPFGDKA